MYRGHKAFLVPKQYNTCEELKPNSPKQGASFATAKLTDTVAKALRNSKMFSMFSLYCIQITCN